MMSTPSDWPIVLKVLFLILILGVMFGCFMAVRIIRIFLNKDPLSNSFPQNILLHYSTFLVQAQNHLSGSVLILHSTFSIVNPIFSCLSQHFTQFFRVNLGILTILISFLGCLSKFNSSLYIKIQPAAVKYVAAIVTAGTFIGIILVSGTCSSWQGELVCPFEDECFKLINKYVNFSLLGIMIFISIILLFTMSSCQCSYVLNNNLSANQIQPINTISLAPSQVHNPSAEPGLQNSAQSTNLIQGKLVVELSTHQKSFILTAVINLIFVFGVCAADQYCGSPGPILHFLTTLINTTVNVVYWILANPELKDFALKKRMMFLQFWKNNP